MSTFKYSAALALGLPFLVLSVEPISYLIVLLNHTKKKNKTEVLELDM